MARNSFIATPTTRSTRCQRSDEIVAIIDFTILPFIHYNATTMNTFRNPVGWFEIYVSDIHKAKAFYEAVLQQELTPMDVPENFFGNLEMMAFPMNPDAPGAGGALVCMTGVPTGGGSTLIYFSCTDVATELSRVADAGGKVHMQKTSINQYGFIGMFIDLDGNMIGLHSMA